MATVLNRSCTLFRWPPPLNLLLKYSYNTFSAGHFLSKPVILAAWEAEIRRIVVQGQPRQKVRPYLKNTQHKIWLAEWLNW
jgi:hypothetical protein